MSYECNPASSRFEIANPLRVDNAFLFPSEAIFVAFAMAAFVEARAALAASPSGKAAAAIPVAAGIGRAISALRQPRFVFGGDHPAGDLPALPPPSATHAGTRFRSRCRNRIDAAAHCRARCGARIDRS